MRRLSLLVAGVLVASLSSGADTVTMPRATLNTSALGQRFLLQISYERQMGGRSFNTSRSRIVAFRREGGALRMLEMPETAGRSAPRLLATIPIRGEIGRTLDVDLNDGFDTVFFEEDRTGEDYYGRIGRHDDARFRLVDRTVASVSYHKATLVFDQNARTDDGQRVVVHYYLTPYHPDPEFQSFEMTSLRRFGFYETYPRWHSGRWVLYAMKFDAHEPIVFALSSAIPGRYRSAVRDGVLYWNQAFGRSILRVIDAPPTVRAPSPDYNVIQWVTSGEYGSTSYIQSDPLTGEILHAHIFLLPEMMMDGDLEQQNDHLRYIVAHEVGHALGLRHNFAPTEPVTVMDYFGLPQILQIGRAIGAGAPALRYDRAVVQHVYFGAPLDVDRLPPFCTDSQQGCMPFRSMPKESEGIRGSAPTDRRSPEN